MRLINGFDVIEHAQVNGESREFIRKLSDYIEDADAVEPKQGEWMPIIEGNEFGETYQSGIYCSECGETLGCEANFCPNCGADMRGDNNETD